MSMNILDLPAEIRLQIYEELLVLSEPIIFRMSWFPPSPPLFHKSAYGLCPALLRASKSVYREAIPLLYSRNRFDFSDIVYYTSC
jgi:2EXR family protein